MYSTPVIDYGPMWQGRALKAEAEANQALESAAYWQQYAKELERQIVIMNANMTSARDQSELISRMNNEINSLQSRLSIMASSVGAARKRARALEMELGRVG
jgi:hypothetical protein